MTLDELIRLKDVMTWAKSKALTGGMFDEIESLSKLLDREIKLKTMDPRKD